MRLPRLLIVLGVLSSVAFAVTACTKSTTPATPSSSAACTVTLGSTTTSVSASATTGTIAVTAASTCAWTAQASASFITISSGSSGTGNGSIAYSIAANTGAARAASIVVNDQTVAFTQAAPILLAPAACSVTVAPTTTKANSGGGTVTVTVTGASNCSWTATSNSSFLTVPSTTTTGSGTVAVTVAGNGGPARSGTVTVGGQTVTITQDPGLIASFNLLDPSQTIGATTVCQIRSLSTTAVATTCKLQSTSFTGGANTIVSYRWVVNYTYQDAVQIDTTSSSPTLTFSDTCGKAGASDDGAFQPLFIQLTVTDNLGNTATANSGQGSQPALQLQLFNCNR
jgi:hypothetical protein